MNEPDTFTAMGCQVAVAGATAAELEAVRELFAEADGRFSRFRDDSELNRVNACAGRVTRVSGEFAAALADALWAAELTGGLVDPTLGAALTAAGYDRDFALLPADGPAAGPARPGCWRSIRSHGRWLWLPRGVQLDLNGVVKSRTVDRARALVAGRGWVSAGGDLAGEAVDVALPGGGSVHLAAGGIATSGSGRRRWLRGRRPQHHLIDPATGAPSTSPWQQVTVAGASCLQADVAAKAAFLLGEDGPAWLEARALPGRLLSWDGAVAETAAWRAGVGEEMACI